MVVATLPGLRAGDHGIIEALSGTRRASKRLADMGFVRGARIMMVRPGTPCIVRLGERCVGLGIDHQEAIQLSPA